MWIYLIILGDEWNTQVQQLKEAIDLLILAVHELLRKLP